MHKMLAGTQFDTSDELPPGYARLEDASDEQIALNHFGPAPFSLRPKTLPLHLRPRLKSEWENN
ncbi:hypothetical protein [Neolewinella persica]|uniref:hypothetical protein n=1 Tax=Neolewinella persica TaxID=70998 RepID=UPI0003A4F50E|nr:hypothetical protein [Neolewinella persica]